MSETTDQGKKKTLTLGKKLDVKKSVESDQVRQSFAHGRSKTVAVEVKRKRVIGPGDKHQGRSSEHATLIENNPALANLTEGELETRLKVLQDAMKADAIAAEERARKEKEDQEKRLREELERKQLEETLESSKKSEIESVEIEDEAIDSEEESSVSSIIEEEVEPQLSKEKVASPHPSKIKTKEPAKPAEIKHVIYRAQGDDEEDDGIFRKRNASKEVKRAVTPVRKEAETPRKLNRNVLTRVLEDEEVQRGRSMASLKRARQKQSKQSSQQTENLKVIREVTIPDFISVGELANRMAVRSAEVIKSLMKLGMMVTINQMIDADTAELLCTEFGHKFKRVSESDIEIGLGHQEDPEADLLPRAPVVTVMGHVDHGKTSLLDALRSTDIVSGEAGGITQHIGAYQVTMKSGQKITFVDTPGHAAFTEMRARGANITDIVVLVVAADDGIMEQTIEAINHAKAAEVPIVVAINKIDKPEANPDRVRNELLNQGIVLEDFGGDVLSVEVSAKQRLNLEKLEEAILLQAEILDLKANPDRPAEGAVIEAKIDRGRGTVATVLVQRGSLKVGDIFVAGTEWGRVRALIDDRGNKIEVATPSMPVEILGFNGVPAAGDEFFVVDSESRAREISEYRQRRDREAKAVASARTTMEQMMSKIASGETKELAVVIKSDVQGSLEAIASSLAKLGTDEVSVNILHGAVGGISESDITLARASGGIIIGFNVRANPQARELARRDGVDIRYYSIIYDVIDDIKAMMGGLLAPTLREKFLGTAEIREVFNIPKVGKIAGCYVTEGMVKRGTKVRLLRDNVVIHEGTLKTLKRFKDEVKEVKESYECGMAFENYNDIRVGDVIECFEMESIARQL